MSRKVESTLCFLFYAVVEVQPIKSIYPTTFIENSSSDSKFKEAMQDLLLEFQTLYTIDEMINCLNLYECVRDQS